MGMLKLQYAFLYPLPYSLQFHSKPSHLFAHNSIEMYSLTRKVIVSHSMELAKITIFVCLNCL